MPERVWEQSLTADLVEAGVQYIVLDDAHFKAAGIGEDQLHGYYITEDGGKLLRVFPGSERLRYDIPFAAPNAAIDYLRGIAERQPGAVAVFADDGEKFGSWPDTKSRCTKKAGCGSFSTWCAPTPIGFRSPRHRKPSTMSRRWERCTFPKAAIGR